MRNPFKRRDDAEMIPVVELPPEAAERLEGVTLYQVPEGSGFAVFVNIDAVEAEVANSGVTAEVACNNRDNWVLGGVDAMADDDTRYGLMGVHLDTGRIGR